jgi:hypothetical protein
MIDQDESKAPDPRAEERMRVRDTRRAIVFGVVMATIQMAILLYLMYG